MIPGGNGKIVRWSVDSETRSAKTYKCGIYYEPQIWDSQIVYETGTHTTARCGTRGRVEM
jgi:hypothetical protein